MNESPGSGIAMDLVRGAVKLRENNIGVTLKCYVILLYSN